MKQVETTTKAAKFNVENNTSIMLHVSFSIVEDGIMVQISQDRMMQIRKSLNNMEDCRIDCGHVGSDKPDETVYIKWIENDQSVNAG